MPKAFAKSLARFVPFLLPFFSQFFQTHTTAADLCTLILRYPRVCSVPSRGSLSNFHIFSSMRCAGVLSGTEKLVPSVDKRRVSSPTLYSLRNRRTFHDPRHLPPVQHPPHFLKRRKLLTRHTALIPWTAELLCTAEWMKDDIEWIVKEVLKDSKARFVRQDRKSVV